jgi:hypothetical protein
MDSEELRLRMALDGIHRLKVRLFKLDKRLWATLRQTPVPSSLTSSLDQGGRVGKYPTLSQMDGEWE